MTLDIARPLRSATSFSKMNYREQIAVLQAACHWLNIPSGRAHHYQRLMKEFWDGQPREKDHIFVHNEAYEIVDLYQSWHERADEFLGLKSKIAAAVGGGPILTEHERSSTSSNRPRNDAFVYLLAGELLEAGINVVAVDGAVRQGVKCHTNGDVTFDWEGGRIDVQCKRPQTDKAVIGRIREARRQIERVESHILGGIVAVDFSAFLRPTGKLIEKSSSDDALEVCRRQLEQWIPVINKELSPGILGFYLHVRAPAMIVVKEYRILSMSERPYREYRPDSVTASAMIENPGSQAPGIVSAVHDCLSAVLSKC